MNRSKSEKIIAGTRFGRLTALGEVELRGKSLYQLCLCDCGKTKFIAKGSLRYGSSQSCGCLQAEQAADRQFAHGHTSRSIPGGATKIYRAWSHMWSRCTNPKVIEYPRYGGRGITICVRWQSFENFLKDMGEPPTKNSSIDRLNVDGNYEPGNCAWRTPTEQSRNKRNNIRLTVKGVTMLLIEWTDLLELPYENAKWRFHAGWPHVKILTTPFRKMRRQWSRRAPPRPGMDVIE